MYFINSYVACTSASIALYVILIHCFLDPRAAADRGNMVNPSITRYSVKVVSYNYDISAYGFREFFKRHKIAAPLAAQQ